jgi:hypothetical protein
LDRVEDRDRMLHSGIEQGVNDTLESLEALLKELRKEKKRRPGLGTGV